MMTPHRNHPARDPGFLSRLHDGELSASERAHFESHRAHCNECLRLAAEYEDALKLFRSARSAPAPADMASRVLRKVRTVGGSHPAPAKGFFTVDWRWASGFAAALLVLLIAAPALLRQQTRARDVSAPIHVVLAERAPRSDAAPKAPVPGDAGETQLQGAPASAPQEAEARSNSAPRVVPPAAQNNWAPAPAQAQEKSANEPRSQRNSSVQRNADQTRRQENGAIVSGQAPVVQAQRAQAPPAPAQAAGGRAQDEVSAAQNLKTLDQASGLVILDDDGLGPAPRLLSGADPSTLAPLQGRSFVVLVDPSGSVSEVREAPKQELRLELKRREGTLNKEKDAAASPEPLKRLQFAVSDRPRRLLLRVPRIGPERD